MKYQNELQAHLKWNHFLSSLRNICVDAGPVKEALLGCFYMQRSSFPFRLVQHCQTCRDNTWISHWWFNMNSGINYGSNKVRDTSQVITSEYQGQCLIYKKLYTNKSVLKIIRLIQLCADNVPIINHRLPRNLNLPHILLSTHSSINDQYKAPHEACWSTRLKARTKTA